MTIYNCHDVAQIAGIQSKHVWYDVKRHGVMPKKVHGINVLTREQLDRYIEARAGGGQSR